MSDQLHDMALISLQTGMRAGGAFNLKWVYLDYPNDIILVADPKKGVSSKAFMTPEVKQMLLNRGEGAPEELVFPARGEKQIAGISKEIPERSTAWDSMKGSRMPVNEPAFIP